MELLSGNLQIVENIKKKMQDMSCLTLKPKYMYIYIEFFFIGRLIRSKSGHDH